MRLALHTPMLIGRAAVVVSGGRLADAPGVLAGAFVARRLDCSGMVRSSVEALA